MSSSPFLFGIFRYFCRKIQIRTHVYSYWSMLGGMLIGFLLRRQEFSWIGKVITLLIWALLFLLGIEVGGNRQIVEGLATLGVEAFVITLACVDRKSVV